VREVVGLDLFGVLEGIVLDFLIWTVFVVGFGLFGVGIEGLDTIILLIVLLALRYNLIWLIVLHWIWRYEFLLVIALMMVKSPLLMLGRIREHCPIFPLVFLLKSTTLLNPSLAPFLIIRHCCVFKLCMCSSLPNVT